MFYDDAFRRITENSAFSETAVLTIGQVEYELRGFFYSGNYGEKKLDKGYSTLKTVKAQSFQMSRSSLPYMLDIPSLARQKLTIRGTDYTIREAKGNDSGMLVMDIVPTGGAS